MSSATLYNPSTKDKAAMNTNSNSQSYLNNTVEVITITSSLNRSERKRSATIDMPQVSQQLATTTTTSISPTIACLSSLQEKALAFITIWGVVTSQFHMTRLRISPAMETSMPSIGRHRIVWVIWEQEPMWIVAFQIAQTNNRGCESVLTTFSTPQ